MSRRISPLDPMPPELIWTGKEFLYDPAALCHRGDYVWVEDVAAEIGVPRSLRARFGRTGLCPDPLPAHWCRPKRWVAHKDVVAEFLRVLAGRPWKSRDTWPFHEAWEASYHYAQRNKIYVDPYRLAVSLPGYDEYRPYRRH